MNNLGVGVSADFGMSSVGVGVKPRTYEMVDHKDEEVKDTKDMEVRVVYVYKSNAEIKHTPFFNAKTSRFFGIRRVETWIKPGWWGRLFGRKPELVLAESLEGLFFTHDPKCKTWFWDGKDFTYMMCKKVAKELRCFALMGKAQEAIDAIQDGSGPDVGGEAF